MFVLKRIGCRIYQLAFRAVLPILPYREPRIISACADIGDVCQKEKANSVLIVTSASIVKNGFTAPIVDTLSKNNIR